MTEEREDQAIAWLVRLNSGEADADDWRALEVWLATDAANQTALARVEALWGELDDQAYPLKRNLDDRAGAAIVTPLVPRRTSVRPGARAWPRWAAAAVVALAVGGVGFAVVRTLPTSYQTAPGEIRRIALSDGTRIDLNGGSRLAVRFDGAARRVTMADAEAAFDVTKDLARPFLITAGDQQIRVVGTAFDVINHGGQLVVTVRRGVVQVADASPRGIAGEAARIPAGYQLTRRQGDDTTSIKAVDPEEAVAWRERRLVYHDQSLANVAADLSRAFAVPVQVSGEARDLRFSGVLVLDHEDAVLGRLKRFLPVDVGRSQSAIVLSSRP